MLTAEASPPQAPRARRFAAVHAVVTSSFAVFAAVVAAGVGLPLAVRLVVGDVPANDEWSFAKAALAMHAGSGAGLQGFNQMFLVGQLLATQPLISLLGPAGLIVFGVLAGALWLGMVLVLVRPVLGPSRALLLVLVLAVSPLFMLLSSSYMTDVPAAAAAFTALVLCAQALERASLGRLVVALALVVAAFSVREQAAVVLVALAATVGVTWPRLEPRFRGVAVRATVACVAVCVVLEHLRHGLAHGDAPPFGLRSVNVVGAPDALARGLFTIALLLAPLLVPTALRALRRGGRRVLLVGAGTLGLATLLLFTGPGWTFLLGNYVKLDGPYAEALVGSAAPALSAVTWPLTLVTALLAAVGLLSTVTGRIRPGQVALAALRDLPVRTVLLYAYGLLLGTLYLGMASMGQHQYDRYALPLLPAVGVFVLGGAGPGGRGDAPWRQLRRWTVVGCAFTAGLSLVLCSTAYTRDAAVWRAASDLTARGVPATSINAGSAWNGWHASTPLVRSPGDKDAVEYAGDTWARRFPRSRDCFVVTLSSLSGSDWRRVRTAQIRPLPLGLATTTVYTYERVGGRPFGHGACAGHRPAA